MDIRNFKSDDADFFSASRVLCKHFENMLANFINFDSDFNAPFIDNWLTAIEDSEAHSTNETERDELRIRSDEVERRLSAFLEKLNELEYYCHKAFDNTDPDTLLLFAFDQRTKALQSIPRFILWYVASQNFYDDQLPHLLNAGMPLQLDSDLENFAEIFFDAEIAQEEYKRIMKVSTRKRIAKLNNVFSFNKNVNNAAQVIYRNEPLKRALFNLEK